MIKITINYTESEIITTDENTLKIYRYDVITASWVALTACVVNTTENTITCETDHFSTFWVFWSSGSSSSTSSSSGGWSGWGGWGGSSSSSSSSSLVATVTTDDNTDEETDATDESIEDTDTAPESLGTEDKGDYTVDNQSCSATENLLSDTYMSDYVTTFGDIDTATYKEEIIKLEKAGIVKGKEAGVFDAMSEITRAEFLAIVLQAHCYDISIKPEELPFHDVDISTWQSNVIATWLENNIIAWDIDEDWERVFRANDSISKIEALAIIMNLRDVTLKSSELDNVHTYTDVAAEWQNSYLNTATALWVLVPINTNNIFSPNLKLNRDQLVWIMFDIMELY